MFEYTAQILRVVDGDTVDIEVDLGFETYRETRTRLASINTAELTSQDETQRILAHQAKAFVEKALPVSSMALIRTFKDKREKYGRYLVMIYPLAANGTWSAISINEALIEQGLAVPYMIMTSPRAPSMQLNQR